VYEVKIVTDVDVDGVTVTKPACAAIAAAACAAVTMCGASGPMDYLKPDDPKDQTGIVWFTRPDGVRIYSVEGPRIRGKTYTSPDGLTTLRIL
jgi:hypothetical protein